MHAKIPLVAGCASKRYNPISVLAVSLILFTSFSLAGAQTNQPPSAVAMALTGQDDGTVNGGRRVWLNAGGSTDPDGDSLTYTWRQTAGTTVTIYDDPSGDAARSYFTAPGATSTASTLTFEVTVDDGTTTSTANIDVVVRGRRGQCPDQRFRDARRQYIEPGRGHLDRRNRRAGLLGAVQVGHAGV